MEKSAFTREFIRKVAKECGVELPKEMEDALVQCHLDARDVYAEKQVRLYEEKHQKEAPVNVKDTPEYKELETDFKNYKADQEALHLKARKIADYGEKVLKPAGVPPERWDAIIRLTDIDAMEYGDTGLADIDHLIESVKTEWADYIPTVTNVGAETANPPANSATRTFTRDEIRKMTPSEINENFSAIKASLKGEN